MATIFKLGSVAGLQAVPFSGLELPPEDAQADMFNDAENAKVEEPDILETEDGLDDEFEGDNPQP